MSKQIFITLGLAFAYALAAELGHMVSLPDQTATLLWPPSGIALAALLVFGREALPGIVLGALAINLWSHHTAPISVMLVVAVTITAVSTVASWMAAVLIRRTEITDTATISALHIFKASIVLVGASAFAASGGIGIQYYFDLLPEGMAAVGWGMWVVGDYCGMLIFTPLIWFVFLLLGSSRAAWRNNDILGAAFLHGLIAVIALLIFSSNWNAEEARISDSLQRESAIVAGNLSRNLHMTRHDISSIQALIYSSDSVTDEEFRRYVRAHMSNRELGPPAQAVGWSPRVKDPVAWEAWMQQHVTMDVSLYELDQTGYKVPVAQRSHYFPVQFIRPLEGNRPAVGFDLSSELKRRTALEHARDSGQVAVVAPIFLVQSESALAESAMLVCLPVYHPDVRLDSIAARRANLLGYVSGVYFLNTLFDSAVPGYSEDIDLRLFDISLPAQEQLYYTKLSRYRDDAVSSGEFSPSFTSLQEGPHGLTRLTFAGHDWVVLATPGPTFIESQRSLAPWKILFAILAFGVVLTCFLVERLTVIHTVKVETRKTEEALLQARAANESKEYFMAAAAHDIKQPLYALNMIVDSLLMTDLAPRSVPVVRSLRESITQMSRHFDVLMDIGRFRDGNFSVNPTSFRLSRLAARIDQEIAPLCAEKELGWKLEMEDALVCTDEDLLLRLFRNLLINAVNYTTAGEVRCSAKIEGGFVEFLVSDTGIGIDEEQQEVVFDQFVQLNLSGSESAKGIGLGLSIVEKINHALGLELQIFSAPREGTRFKFRLPAITT